MSDTPETDKIISVGLENADRECVPAEFARKLERERDEVQKAVNNLCNHLGVNPANTTLLAVEILKIIRERDEARGLLASEKITRDHIIKRGVEVQKERDEAWDNLKITQQEWARARRERAEALRERDEAREALRALAPLTYHDCHFSKDMMGNCILCKREETK